MYRLHDPLVTRYAGTPAQRHNHVRDLTATLLAEVAHNVVTEPHLQPLTGEHMRYATANIDDLARLDIAADGFWGGPRERAFFDVRVFNPFACSNASSNLSAVYRQHERVKTRAYEQRILQVEHGSFTPLVFSATGGMAPRCTTFFRRLCDLLATKRQENYSRVMGLVRAKLGFSLLRDQIACMRGARSLRCSSLVLFPQSDVAFVESRVEV